MEEIINWYCHFSVCCRARGPAHLLPANHVHPPQHLPLQRAEQEEQAQVRHRLGHLLRARPLKPHPKDLLSGGPRITWLRQQFFCLSKE